MAQRPDNEPPADQPPTDREAQKSYRQILTEEIDYGMREHGRPSVGLLISGLSAGLDLSFSLLLMAVALTVADGTLPATLRELLAANLYTVGFIFVVIGRSELFTEHTTLAVLPVLNRRATFRSLLRLWVLVYAGNVAGTALFAYFATEVGPALGVADKAAYVNIARLQADHDVATLLMSAALAGWLMGLMSWLVVAARETISQIFIIWVIAFCIGFAKLPHCILGSAEVLGGLLAGGVPAPADYFRFLLIVTAGNAVGGVFFVAIIKYSYVVRSTAH